MQFVESLSAASRLPTTARVLIVLKSWTVLEVPTTRMVLQVRT